MKIMCQKFQKFLTCQNGATAIEYGLISGMMAVAAIMAFGQMGNGLVNLFGSTNDGAGQVVHDAANSAELN